MTDRAQALTLEAFVAALLLLGCVTFALHVAGVTANTGSTANDHVENQHRGLASGVLEGAVANHSLRPTLLYWNATAGAFHGAGEGGYEARAPPTTFGEVLEEMFDDRNLRYNVDVRYVADGDVRTRRLVDQGTPSDDAVRVAETVTLYDADRLHTEAGEPSDVTLEDVETEETTTFYAPDADPDGPVYNVVRVEVIAWRA